jgi:hypothetical protein
MKNESRMQSWGIPVLFSTVIAFLYLLPYLQEGINKTEKVVLFTNEALCFGGLPTAINLPSLAIALAMTTLVFLFCLFESRFMFKLKEQKENSDLHADLQASHAFGLFGGVVVTIFALAPASAFSDFAQSFAAGLITASLITFAVGFRYGSGIGITCSHKFKLVWPLNSLIVAIAFAYLYGIMAMLIIVLAITLASLIGYGIGYEYKILARKRYSQEEKESKKSFA